VTFPVPGDKVLWIRFWAFGDVLEAVANAYNFKKHFPDVRLSFLTNPEYAPLLRVQPYFDEVLAGRKKPFAEWRKTLRQIQSGEYQWLVSAHRGGRTSLLARFSRTPHRIGSCSVFPLNWNYHIGLESWVKGCNLDVTDRSAPSLFPAAEDLESACALLSHLPKRRLFAAIGAGNVKKMWPAERWIELLSSLLDRGWGVVLNGHGPFEETIGKQIEQALQSSALLNLVGALDFRKMLGAARSCTLALGNDTGPTHLAALSGVPTIGLFSHSTSRRMGLRMPWFQELCAEEYVTKGQKIPLKALPSEPVAAALDSFVKKRIECHCVSQNMDNSLKKETAF
jgi:ADP-heptose:LPS heptosyltransferase